MQDHTLKIQKIDKLWQESRIEEALTEARLLIREFPDHLQIQYCCSTFLIDCGSFLEDIDSVNFGISLIETILENLEALNKENDSIESIRQKAELTYNLFNGYSAKACLLKKKFNQESEEYEKAIIRQKELLKSIILRRKLLEPKFLASCLVNYANLLRDLGRHVEAIDYYYDCLKLYPEHAVAIGNCGSVLQELINFSVVHNSKILYEIWWLFKEANHRKLQLEKLAGKHIVAQYQNALTDFEEDLFLNVGGAKKLEKSILEWEKVHSWEPSSFFKQLRDDRLLLTVNPRPTNCPSEYKDDVCWPSICIPLNDTGKELSQSLVHTFNHIKEDFSTARYLYYKSLSQDTELINCSQITHYLQALDYADFGLRSGLLKTSLRIAVDCLDKCACFLSLYLDLKNDKSAVIWNNVWYNKLNHKKGIHPEIKKRLSSNFSLAALYDLQKEIYSNKLIRNQSIFPYKDLRNCATHQLLVLYGEGTNKDTMNHWKLETFQEATFFSLRIIKAAIIYLVGVVIIEEKDRDSLRKQNGEEGTVAEGLPYELGVGLSDECDIPDIIF
jgi:tetratricopeptide (TPR) repeat protein